jgi:hypothetical protein|tara:strand:- start:497 stop:1588 length:1092 start_codon:yes stop_codon:yes gene_type:complete
MTDKEIIEDQDQDVELQEDDEEILEMQHDPKNAEAQSIAATDKAGDATGTAKLPSMGTAKNVMKRDPMPKLTKAGMINAMYKNMKKADKKKLEGMYNSVMQNNSTDPEAFDGESIQEEPKLEIKHDFKDDLKALVSEEATLSDEFKQKAETIFETAINSKLADEIDRLEEKYNEEITAEVENTKADLVEKVDNYLNYVVENWMKENELAIQTGLRTEIAEDFMNKLKDVFEESYIAVPEGKTDLVDELADTVDDLENRLNDTTRDAIEMAEELEGYKRDAIIREASKDLAETQVEKLKGLVEKIDFEDEETFSQKVATVKESYFTNTKITTTGEEVADDDEAPIQASGSMASYLSAIKKTANK